MKLTRSRLITEPVDSVVPASVREYVKRALADALKRIGADSGSIWLFDDQGTAHVLEYTGTVSSVVAEFPTLHPVGSDANGPKVVADLTEYRNEAISELLERVIAEGTRAFIACPMTDSSGEVFGSFSVGFNRRYQPSERLLTFMNVLTERVSAALQSTTALTWAREHEQALEVYARLSAAIADAHDVQQVLRLIVENAHQLIHASRCVVLLRDAGSGELVSAAATDPAEEGELRIPADAPSMAQRAISTGEVQRLTNAEAEPKRFSSKHTDRVRSAVLVPLIAFGDRLGVLGVADDRGPRTFSDDEVRRLTILANHAAIAIHHGRVLESLALREAELETLSERLVVAHEEERSRLSHELKSLVGRQIDLISQSLDAGKAALAESDFETASQRCAAARGMVQEAASSARTLSVELHPGILDDLGLVPALRWYCGELRRTADIEVELMSPRRLEVDPDVARTIYRAAQESLKNVVMHAHAKHASVELCTEPDRVVLEVSDDGRGFDLRQQRADTQLGIGILGMRERARHLGGELRVTTAPGAGTRVRLDIPTQPA